MWLELVLMPVVVIPVTEDNMNRFHRLKWFLLV